MYTSVALTPDIYHIGDDVTNEGLNCHPYLLIDGEDVVLFDPGSLLDIHIVLAKLESLVPLSRVNYVVLHHHDPDFCSAMPFLEEKGLNALLITSWRSMSLMQYYKIKTPYYLLEEHANELILKSGRRLEFILTPYLHFAGSFMTYDAKTKTLFSSDLFGAFSFNKTFYADDSYMEKMRTFHEHYMPSNAIMRPVMDLLLTYPIDRILPQHGSLIIANPEMYIRQLQKLECGLLMIPIKKNLMASGGYLNVFNEILTRYTAVYNHAEVQEVFKSIPELHFNEAFEVTSFDQSGLEIWNRIFETIREQKGLLWLSVIEPYAKLLASTYDIPLPSIFNTLLESAHEATEKLLEINRNLDKTIRTVQEKLIRCPITELYNETFFKSVILEELENEDWREIGSLVLINVDGLYKLKQNYGEAELKNTLINMAYLLKNTFGETSVFKMQIADFAVYATDHNPDELISVADSLRTEIAHSDLFIEPLTVSIGVAFPREIQLDAPTLESALDSYMDVGISRLRHAQESGQNIICHLGDFLSDRSETFKVLVVDPDRAHLDVLKTFLSELEIHVYVATDGDEALHLAGQHLPNLIITDVMLPKIDGFLLREKLLQRSSTKHIEFIYVSHQKDEATINRAMSLGVIHYLKKPYLLSELIGITNKIRKGLTQ